MICYSIYNSKGGVGKTTTAIHLALGFKYKRPTSRILLIDMDAQYSIKTYFRLKFEGKEDTFGFIFGTPLEKCIHHISSIIDGQKYEIDVLPSSASMSAFDSKASSIAGSENLLRVRFEEEQLHAKYDYVIVDCPPAFNQSTLNALAATDYLIAPAIMDDYAIPSLKYIQENINVIKRNLRTNKPEFLGVLPTQFDNRQSVARSIYEILPTQIKLNVFSPIRLNAAFKKAQVQRSCVFQTERNSSKSTEDYLKLCDEVLSCVPQNKPIRLNEAVL